MKLNPHRIKGLGVIAGLLMLLPVLHQNITISPKDTNSDLQNKVNPEDVIYNYTNTTKIFYSRLRKCGSATTMVLFRVLAKRNNWLVDDSLDNEVDTLYRRTRQFWTQDPNILQKYVDTVIGAENNSLIQIHTHHIDFSRYISSDFPVYINLVREPLDRLLSNYYFDLYHDIWNLSSTFDECVAKQEKVCVDPSPSGYFTLIPWFCGHDPVCGFPNKAAIQIAKYHVEKDYALIGLKEYYDEFLEALELMFPQFFRRARQVYDNLPQKKKNRWNNTYNRVTPTEKTISIMDKLLVEEREFYHYIKQRFFVIYHTLKKHNKL